MYARCSPSAAFTQDFNTNFLRTSNSGTARSELVNVSQNHGGESRRQQDPNHPPKRRRVLNREIRKGDVWKFSQPRTGILTALRVGKISVGPKSCRREFSIEIPRRRGRWSRAARSCRTSHVENGDFATPSRSKVSKQRPMAVKLGWSVQTGRKC